jgi:hypothetical protein
MIGDWGVTHDAELGSGENLKKHLLHLIWILLFAFGSPCPGQTIKVRVLNYKTGQPLQKQPISISLLYRLSALQKRRSDSGEIRSNSESRDRRKS